MRLPEANFAGRSASQLWAFYGRVKVRRSTRDFSLDQRHGDGTTVPLWLNVGWGLKAKALLDITDPSAVRKAIYEFDELGREVFLARHGFKPARTYFLVFAGRKYDSKAIIGVAHGYQFPEKGPLRAADFSGGDATVKARLESLGYTVESDNGLTESFDKQYTSASLNVKEVYSREQLSELFGIRDATLNTGLFRPKDYHSLWIFLTETKTSDRTPYENRLTEDAVYFQSQTRGRKDDLLIGHGSLGIELLVFYRKSKFQFPNAGFRYEGAFRYVSHKGREPRSFVLRRVQDEIGESQLRADREGCFDPKDIKDGRVHISAAIALRRGQRAFRLRLLHEYAGRCAITGCDCVDALEAAHIYPFLGDQTNTPANGLLLRADVHTLFDLKLISIHPKTRTVVIAETLKRTSYADLDGKLLAFPESPSARPSSLAVEWHFRESGL